MSTNNPSNPPQKPPPPPFIPEANALRGAFEGMFSTLGDILHHFAQSSYSGLDQITLFPPETYINKLGRELEYIDDICDQMSVNLENAREILEMYQHLSQSSETPKDGTKTERKSVQSTSTDQGNKIKKANLNKLSDALGVKV
ncbi:hypothetical protein BKA69DRAFT_1096919 [Paraphysoderma sedebokerense]|nr:hypothetical protein BKA69DRAFT_1096919 [Paraphysoderma sedebokerense]